MIKRLLTSTVLVFTAASSVVMAQNTNSSETVRPRTTAAAANTNSQKSADPQKSTDVQQPTTTQPTARRTETKPRIAETPASQSVIAAFNELINGIRHADVKAVTSVYLNSPRLILFNNNGTVTKGWEQLRMNRESAYREVKDVKLDVRDLSITMLGRDGAVVSCLWTQSQTYKGTPETYRPHDSRVQTHRQRLEGDPSTHFTGPA